METETLFYKGVDEVKVHIPMREKDYGWSVRQIVILDGMGPYEVIVVYERIITANPDLIAARDKIAPMIAQMLDDGAIECAEVVRVAVNVALGVTTEDDDAD